MHAGDEVGKHELCCESNHLGDGVHGLLTVGGHLAGAADGE